MISAFEEIRRAEPRAEFHVVGDKFHNDPPTPRFEARVREGLLQTEGIQWHGGVSRSAAQRVLSLVDVASSWRDERFRESVELSTKVLEYASLGLPVILNRNGVQEDLFGSEYAGFAESKTDFVHSFQKFTQTPEAYSSFSRQSLEIARRYTFSRALNRLEPHLPVRPQIHLDLSGSKPGQTTVLLAGHKLNFVEPLAAYWAQSPHHVLLVDQWNGHRGHDEARSIELVKQADLVFCEWCLGNAVWYTQHAQPRQRIVIRLHSQEMRLEFLNKLRWERVDALVAVCPQHYATLCERFPSHKSRIHLIYNFFDTDRFERPKLEGSEFNLGFMGLVPLQKNPRMAFEIFKMLRSEDSRFNLYFLGKKPDEYDWMANRPGELRQYRHLFDEIEGSAHRNAVIFDRFTDDVPAWLSKIGFLLSTSEHEGSHQAVAEAMASGAIPVIRNWKGADQLYPSEYVFSTPDEAAELIRRLKTPGQFLSSSSQCRKFAVSSFSLPLVLPQILALADSRTNVGVRSET
jgi:glycosyltransferase involved in cell wall biosynthesis